MVLEGGPGCATPGKVHLRLCRVIRSDNEVRVCDWIKRPGVKCDIN